MTGTSITIHTEGALFRERGGRMVQRWIDDGAAEQAKWAEHRVRELFHQAFQHGTGYYESQIRRDRVSGDRFEVTDSGVVYGPWLEGVGSRNFPVTKFRGYAVWDHVGREAEARGGNQMNDELQRHMGEL